MVSKNDQEKMITGIAEYAILNKKQ